MGGGQQCSSPRQFMGNTNIFRIQRGNQKKRRQHRPKLNNICVSIFMTMNFIHSFTGIVYT
jgi:hypothetical protein